jgi:hypothetical protein
MFFISFGVLVFCRSLRENNNFLYGIAKKRENKYILICWLEHISAHDARANSRRKEEKKGRSYFVEDWKEMKEEKKKFKKANVRGTN